MQASDDQNIIEEYIETREKEEKDRGDQLDQELDHKKEYIKIHLMDQYQGDQEILEEFAVFFLNYLKETKGIETEQHNLDLLNLAQIEEIVAKFKAKYPKEWSKVEVKIQEEPSEIIIGESIPVITADSWNPKKIYYSNGAWDYELSGYEECRREKVFFGQEIDPKNNAIIFSKNYTRKRGGFFGIIGGTLELWIDVKSNFIKDPVERTVSDFIFLRNALTKIYPYSLIPPLDITEKDLSKIDSQPVKIYILNECRRFLNSICKLEPLYQNIYTFKFFKENKYDNYCQHKRLAPSTHINHIKILNNIDGCVPIELSDQNQATKKDYSRKSQMLQKMWKKIAESNHRITQHLKDIQVQLALQRKQLGMILSDISYVQQKIHSEGYEKLSEILFCYNDVYTIYGDNFKQYQEFFEAINYQLGQQMHRNWKNFAKYKGQVGQFCLQYQVKRKAFLQKQINPNKPVDKVTKEQSKIIEDKANPNLSVIIELGIDSTSERQLAWIERYSKWQAYINKQFTQGFERLIEYDRYILTKLLQERAQKVLESGRREQQSFINHVSIIQA